MNPKTVKMLNTILIIVIVLIIARAMYTGGKLWGEEEYYVFNPFAALSDSRSSSGPSAAEIAAKAAKDAAEKARIAEMHAREQQRAASVAAMNKLFPNDRPLSTRSDVLSVTPSKTQQIRNDISLTAQAGR